MTAGLGENKLTCTRRSRLLGEVIQVVLWRERVCVCFFCESVFTIVFPYQHRCCRNWDLYTNFQGIKMRLSRGSVIALWLVVSPFLAHGIFQNGSEVAPCDSPIYCYGKLLEAIELAHPFHDSKTFVDMPTSKPLDEVMAAFEKLTKLGRVQNNTDLHNFLTENFGDAGSELQTVSSGKVKIDTVMVNKIEDAVLRQFVAQVMGIWPSLTRTYTGPNIDCDGCEDSFIELNRTFVVAGGRFREVYYWDTYWIIEGLLRSGGDFTQISKNMIENFLDLVERFGFVPNGSRVYYLNRSQPPLLSQMVKIYVDYTNDTSILERALPLLIKEHDFWMTNRTYNVTVENTTYTLNQYIVSNTTPRPESYYEDFSMANNRSYVAKSGTIYNETKPLSQAQKLALYANLASGAESGCDYSSTWLANPNDAAKDVYFPLRSLNILEITPVDLNSILYANEMTIAEYLKAAGDNTRCEEFRKLASQRAEGMFKLMWNDKYHSYFDYNKTSQSQSLYVPVDKDATASEKADAPEGYQVYFHVSQLYPFWLGAAPPDLKDNPFAVVSAFQRVDDLLSQKPGGIAATNFESGQQWDQPNVWPPFMYILMKGLLNTRPTFGTDDPYYIKTQELAKRLAQRYIDITFCTWRATGGSTAELPQLPGTNPNSTGLMFEKYTDNVTNIAGGGGEYEVVEGFGWTNGALIWIADKFPNLTRPVCPPLNPKGKRDLAGGLSAVELHPFDAKYIKKFGPSH